MPVTLVGTGIQFPDSTTQTTAATGGASGGRGQVFTSSGTFTIPTGITAVKVTIVGGGGGGGGTGTNGFSGGNSSIQSGTQSITTVTSNGGSGATRSDAGGAAGSGGTTTNATLGYTGGQGQGRDGSRSGGAVMGSSTNTTNSDGLQYVPSGPWGSAGNVRMGITPSGQGNGGGGYYEVCGPGAGGGGAGGLSYVWLTGLTPGNTIGVTVGSGGNGGNAPAQAGRAGIVIFEY